MEQRLERRSSCEGEKQRREEAQGKKKHTQNLGGDGREGTGAVVLLLGRHVGIAHGHGSSGTGTGRAGMSSLACTAQAPSPLLKTQALTGPLFCSCQRGESIALVHVPVRPPTHSAKTMEGLRESLGTRRKESRKISLL